MQGTEKILQRSIWSLIGTTGDLCRIRLTATLNSIQRIIKHGSKTESHWRRPGSHWNHIFETGIRIFTGRLLLSFSWIQVTPRTIATLVIVCRKTAAQDWSRRYARGLGITMAVVDARLYSLCGWTCFLLLAASVQGLSGVYQPRTTEISWVWRRHLWYRQRCLSWSLLY